mgnify:CR=1 FL=1
MAVLTEKCVNSLAYAGCTKAKCTILVRTLAMRTIMVRPNYPK